MRRVAPLIFGFMFLIIPVAVGAYVGAAAPESPQTPAADGFEPDDVWQDAKPIPSLNLQQRTLSPAGDVDWAVLTIEPGAWSADFLASGSAGSGVFTISLYNSNLNLVATNTAAEMASISRKCASDALPAGTYYLKVESQAGIELGNYTMAWDDYENCALRPDVLPHTPAGYSYPVTPNSVRGTTQANSILYAGKPTYFDWFFINAGGDWMPDDYYSRVYIDGALAFEQKENGIAPGWVGGANDWAYTVASPGWHTVRFETDATGAAAESNESNNVWEHDFYWEAVDGWWGEYFNNPDLAGDPVFVRDDTLIDFDWGAGSPGPGVNADNFSVRWTKDAYLGAETHRFILTHDDGMRFYIGAGLEFEEWFDGSSEDVIVRNIPINWYPLKVEFYEASGNAVARFVRQRCFAVAQAASPVNGGTIMAQPAPNCGSKYIDGMVVTLTATPAEGYRFSGWSGDLSGTQPSKSLTVNAAKSVTANFSTIPCYNLNTIVAPAGAGQVSRDPQPNCAGGKYREGTVVTLQATAGGDHTFSQWSGDLTGAQNPASLTMNGNKTVTANFAPICFSLATAAEPVGSGAVDVLTATNCAGGKYTAGTQVNLSARKNGDYFFTNWSGDAQGSNATIWLTMDGDKSVVAHFSRPTCYAVTTTVTPSLAGLVDVSPAPNCSGGRYSAGTQLTLQATPDSAAYAFDHWSGSISGQSNPRSFTIDSDKAITAHFRETAPTCYELTLDHTGNGGDPQAAPDRSTGCQAGFYVAGETIGVTALPAPGQRVARWEGTNNDGTRQPTNAATMPGNDHTIIAHYEPAPVAYRLFVPVVNDEPCFTGLEQEENDTRQTANGPVCLGQPLFGRPDDSSDYFRLEVQAPWQLDVEMINNAAHLPQLLLYNDQPGSQPLDQATQSPFRLRRLLGPGVYYLRVAIAGGQTDAFYTLLFR